MKMRKKIQENYLEKIPMRKDGIKWTADQNGIVTLEIENKGFFNRLFQLLLKKPKISYIHLDEMGSFVWPLSNGDKTITQIAELVDAHFGKKAHPLYERLAKYFQILESYGFITFKA